MTTAAIPPLPAGYFCNARGCIGRVKSSAGEAGQSRGIWICNKCQKHYQDPSVSPSTDQPRKHRKKAVPHSRPWPDLEESLRNVHATLQRLEPPFTVEVDVFGIKTKEPGFVFDMPDPWRDHNHKAWSLRFSEIHKLLMQFNFSEEAREEACSLIKACDERLRRATEGYRNQIERYRGIITHEKQRQDQISKALSLETLFPLPPTVAPACQRINERLTDAERIIDEAADCLTPCIGVYINHGRGSLRQIVKQRLSQLVSLFIEADTVANKLVAQLLTLADPARPAKASSIGQLKYPRGASSHTPRI